MDKATGELRPAGEHIPTGAEQMPQLMLESQLCFPLYAASRRVVNRYTPFFKPLGITYTQYILFLALWEHDNSTVGDLCRMLFLDNGTVTPVLKKMEECGYVRRERSAEDERVVTVSLTEKGWEMREKAAEIPGMMGSCVSLTAEEAGQLYSILYKLLSQMKE